MSFTSLPGGSPRETDERRRVDALSADEVAAWLQRNPEFFESHRDMLSQLKLRHPHGGRAISLIERQVTVLRDANRMLEKRLARPFNICDISATTPAFTSPVLIEVIAPAKSRFLVTPYPTTTTSSNFFCSSAKAMSKGTGVLAVTFTFWVT